MSGNRFLQRGLQYNVFEANGRLIGYLINGRYLEALSGTETGYIAGDGKLVLGDERVGTIRGMNIVWNNGTQWRLVRVPF